MDLKQLEYFVRVAEVGSFTRAAAALDIAQPALSRQIRLLEVELHQNLLTRNGRGATPTEAGKLLLEHGRGILHQVSRAKEELGRVRGALAGRVAIGMPPSVSRVVAVPLIREFRRTMPDATLSIMEGLTVSMHEALLTGRLDIALLYNATPAPGIELTPLVDEPLFLVERQTAKKATKPRPVSLRDLADFPLVIPSRPNAIRMQVETELAAVGQRPNVVLEIDGVATILDLIQDGAGLRGADAPRRFNLGVSASLRLPAHHRPGDAHQADERHELPTARDTHPKGNPAADPGNGATVAGVDLIAPAAESVLFLPRHHGKILRPPQG
jgi:LysR family nitrogen assimilation transcriptional regulator